ncbi:class I SAM-dependent methyltransferase [Streptomyces ipomoeae]|uniref:Methyltransferase small domain protein n=3 Tax=Streptomyces ipomoeae TaxID=103232 RepID=L1L5J8_9ACTN|nr:class I SAM-dependent methyltransferase [Streptomyces ipomoeae]EKX68326.1 methyltransferase small domain protein [Streptomyces ipomoeae 91-03]MDX2875726.1 class I SAM-dependent methyltransferase [Streptomyces ipomoeae]MDX2935030.1 class I SAM-dependent methyltransferase [Streptomyces ipomoeae]TQE15456.1 class I SAM-dependent methyltransferase [Streptomyces ipomoeae]TQE19708.1 class I SAM-dependent methyltransferase [Streptomyces ipomoeae]
MTDSTLSPLPSVDPPEVAVRLREGLIGAGFTADGLLELLGASAYAALARSEVVPALRATRGDSELEALVRLFLLQQPVARARVERILPVDACVESGWLVSIGDSEVAAAVDVRPYGGPDGEDWFIVSDLGCAVGGAGGIGKRDEGVVLGVGGASTTLAGITVRTPVGSALDLGTGSGIQALHAARHATRVTATDVNPRALHITALTLALSGAPAADLRQGSLFEPVEEDERYDLIVSNPPFVISPGARLIYRDGGMGGDDLCRTLVSQAGERLNEGGFAQFLANWQHVEGEDWQERLRSWVPRGCDAWIVQREVQDVTQYAELWLRDAGDHRGDVAEYQARYDAWLDEFEARKVKAVGFGWITLRKSAAADAEPSITVEEWPHPVEQPLGETVRAHFARVDYLRANDDAALLAGHFRLTAEVVQEQVGLPGAEDPEHVVLRQNRGMRRATKVDTVGAGFAGVCDGTLSAGRILDAIAQLVGEDPVTLRDRTPVQIRLLVEQGFLEPIA